MATTIQISEELRKELQKRKLYGKESYEEVIRDLIEDTLELSEQTKREIAKARAEIKAGKFYTLEQIKKKYGI
jgi:predicted CopG family antitoxin